MASLKELFSRAHQISAESGRENPDVGSVIDSRTFQRDGVDVETYTRIGTGDPQDPEFRRVTNRRVSALNLGTEDYIQLYEGPEGEVKELNSPNDRGWLSRILNR